MVFGSYLRGKQIGLVLWSNLAQFPFLSLCNWINAISLSAAPVLDKCSKHAAIFATYFAFTLNSLWILIVLMIRFCDWRSFVGLNSIVRCDYPTGHICPESGPIFPVSHHWDLSLVDNLVDKYFLLGHNLVQYSNLPYFFYPNELRKFCLEYARSAFFHHSCLSFGSTRVIIELYESEKNLGKPGLYQPWCSELQS